MRISDKLVLTNGAACKTFKSHCPGAFSSDAVGSSTTTTSSSKGSPESPDAGGFGARCGNGIIEPGEECDGPNLDEQTCVTATMGAFTAGMLSCTSSCRLDLSGCMQASP